MLTLTEQIEQTRQYIAAAEKRLALMRDTHKEYNPERERTIKEKQALLDAAREDLRLLLEKQERRQKAVNLRTKYAGIEIDLRDLAFMIEASYGKYSQADFERDPNAGKLLKALHKVTATPDVVKFRIVPVAPRKEKRA